MHVTVYTTPGCVQCDLTKTFLNRRAVPYDLVDLSADDAALEKVRALGYSSAPVVVTADHHGVEDSWFGFRPDRLSGIAAGRHAE